MGAVQKKVECIAHGGGFETFVCEHLISTPAQEWFSSEPSAENKWPDAWCSACNAFFQQEGEWKEKKRIIYEVQTSLPPLL